MYMAKTTIKKTLICCAILAVMSCLATFMLAGCGEKPSAAHPVSDTNISNADDEIKKITADDVRLMLERGETVSDGDFAAPVHLATPSDELNIPDNGWNSLNDSICTVSDSDIITGRSIGDTYLWRTDEQGTVHTIKIRVRKAAYLTIDDWPDFYTTPKILDTLEKHGVKATFFLNASDQHKPLYPTIKAAGHTMGNHTYSHASTVVFEHKDLMLSQFSRMDDFLMETINVKTHFIRLPGGTHNRAASEKGETKRNEFLQILRDNGYRIFDWTATLGDTSATASAKKSIALIDAECDSDFEIILMHHKLTSLNALPSIIKNLRAKDYEFFPITDSTPEYVFEW